MKEVMCEPDYKNFMKFAQQMEDETIEKSTILQLEGDFKEKEARTKLHQFIK